MTQNDAQETMKQSRRRFLREIGATTALVTGTTLAGCQALPVGLGGDEAFYHASGTPLDVDYDAVIEAARESGYTVDKPYFVSVKRSKSGLHPTGISELDTTLGSDYRVFGLTFFYAQTIHLTLWFANGGRPPKVWVFDENITGGDFDIQSLPPDDWIVSRLILAFDMGENMAREYLTSLKDTITADNATPIPSVEVSESPMFPRVYESLVADTTESSGSETSGDGWYKVTFSRAGTRIAMVDFITQSMKISHRRDKHTYIIKLDRLGGFYLTIRLPPKQRIPETEYTDVFMQMFSNIGLPAETIGTLDFEYNPSVW